VKQVEAVRLYERAMRGRGFSPETVAVNLRTVRRFLTRLEVPLRRLRRQHVVAALAAMQRAELAGATQARALGVLRAFSLVLVEAGVLAADPTEGLTVDASEPAPHVVPTVDAVARLLAASDVRPCSGASPALALRDRALLELLYGLGLRNSEARAARVDDLNLADGSLVVRAAKRGHARTLPLPRAALPHLRRYVEEARPLLVAGRVDTGHLIVSKTGRPLRHGSEVGEVVAKAARRAGVRCHPHALRRGVATHLVIAGANIRAVQILLGHQSLGVTQRYVDVRRDDLASVVERLGR